MNAFSSEKQLSLDSNHTIVHYSVHLLELLHPLSTFYIVHEHYIVYRNDPCNTANNYDISILLPTIYKFLHTALLCIKKCIIPTQKGSLTVNESIQDYSFILLLCAYILIIVLLFNANLHHIYEIKHQLCHIIT